MAKWLSHLGKKKEQIDLWLARGQVNLPLGQFHHRPATFNLLIFLAIMWPNFCFLIGVTKRVGSGLGLKGVLQEGSLFPFSLWTLWFVPHVLCKYFSMFPQKFVKNFLFPLSHTVVFLVPLFTQKVLCPLTYFLLKGGSHVLKHPLWP